MGLAHDHHIADFVVARQWRQIVFQCETTVPPSSLEILSRDKGFRRDAVAKPLHCALLAFRRTAIIRVGYPAFTRPYMRYFMDKCENLSALIILSVDERQWSNLVTYGESAKLLHVQGSAIAIAHDAATQNHDAGPLCIARQLTKERLPIGRLIPGFINLYYIADVVGYGFRRVSRAETSNKGKLLRTLRLSIFSEPLLLGERVVQQVQKVRARLQGLLAG